MVTSCVPTTYVPEPMPVLVDVDHQGALTLSFPLCEGEALFALGITGEGVPGERWTLRQGDGSTIASHDEVVSVVFDRDSLTSGSVSSRWPIQVALESGAPIEPSGCEYVFVGTTHYDAGVYPASLTQEGAWLIEGDEIQHGVVPRRVGPEEGIGELERFCATR